MASYESLVKEILPYVPGCPDSVVESNLRSATIEFCEKTKQQKNRIYKKKDYYEELLVA